MAANGTSMPFILHSVAAWCMLSHCGAFPSPPVPPACLQSVLQQLPNLQCLAACFAPIGGTDWQRLNASGPVRQAMALAMARLHQLAAASGLAFTISSSLSF